MATTRVEVEPSLVVQDLNTIEAAASAVLRLLQLPAPPSAIFSSQNLVTIGAIGALRLLNKQHEIALVGYDDFLLADLLEPGVSVVAQDPAEMGRLAAEMLFDRIGGDDARSQQVIVPTRLVARGSGEIPPPASKGQRK